MISVIVPVYNVEEYLKDCIESILCQTYTDFELILINDGSTDNSASVCDEYAKKDERVSVIHQDNSGASSARNNGLCRAIGDYIMFIDSDDYIKDDMFEKLITACEENGADIAVCGATIVQKNGVHEQIKSDVSTLTVCDKEQAAELIIGELNNALWNKLIKKSVIGNNQLEVGKTYGEDYDFIVRILCNCSKVCFIPESLYYYRKNESSVTAAKFSEKRFAQIYYRDKVYELVKANFPLLAGPTDAHRFLARLNICRHIFMSGNQMNYKSELKDYRQFLKTHFSNVKKHLNRKQRAECYIFFMGNGVYKIAVKFLFQR